MASLPPSQPLRSGASPEDPAERLATPAARAGSEDYPGKTLLSGESSSAILRRIAEHDPLELQPRCAERLRERALLIWLPRLHMRALARTAYAARTYHGQPELTAWLAERIEVSLTDLLDEDVECARRGGLSAEEEERYAFMSNALGVEPLLGCRAVVAFHALPYDVRRAFMAVVLEGKTIKRWVAEGHGPPDKVVQDLKHALRAVQAATRIDGDEQAGGDVHG